MRRQPISGWIKWYRFARATLEFGHEEAVVYANLRHVEETNRAAQVVRR
jgi:hypothetical protein